MKRGDPATNDGVAKSQLCKILTKSLEREEGNRQRQQNDVSCCPLGFGGGIDRNSRPHTALPKGQNSEFFS